MYNNYSKINGVMTRKTKNNDIKRRKLKIENCPKCDRHIYDIDIYCKYCGFNLEETSIYTKDVTVSWNYKDIINYFNMPKTLITATFATFILFIISILGKNIISDYISNIDDLVNPIHILLGLNLGSLTYYKSTMMGWSGNELKLGLVVFAILPIISIAISNLIFNKKNIKNIKDVFRNSLGVGISYGIILFILALISRIKINYSYNMMQYGYANQFSFGALGMAIKGFILGFLPTYVVLYRREYEDDNMYLEIFKRAINMLLVGYICTFIIIFILTIVDKSYLYSLGMSSYTDIFSKLVIIAQLSVYIWSFGNFVPVSIGNKVLSFGNLISSDLYSTINLMLIAMFFLSTLVIIVSACKLESKYGKEKGIKPIILMSSFYAILIGTLSITTKLMLNVGTDGLSFSNFATASVMGFGLIESMIITFIYSFVISLMGYKLNIFN
ncbi:Uncharacterised protein [uncultured Clostridium sp.]|nr:Uncharacterised protein [uncultured Clostridium sp.]